MPDLDVFDRSPALGWSKAARLYMGGAEPNELGEAVLEALCHSLRQRDRGGIPALNDLSVIVDHVAAGHIDPHQAMGRLREIEHRTHGHRHTRVAAGAVGQIVAELAGGSRLSTGCEQAVAERFCERIVEHNLFGRIRAEFIGERFESCDEKIDYENQVIALIRPRLAKVAERLVTDPTGITVRKPRSGVAFRQPTSDLLERPIALVGSSG